MKEINELLAGRELGSGRIFYSVYYFVCLTMCQILLYIFQQEFIFSVSFKSNIAHTDFSYWLYRAM